MIWVNGTQRDCISGCTISDLLANLGHNPLRIALELNGDIIAREDFSQTLLHDGDHVEIVQFVGGG